MKGISREVIPYSVDSMIDTSTDRGDVVIERLPGMDFYLDPSIVKSADTERIRAVLLGGLSSLDKRRVVAVTITKALAGFCGAAWQPVGGCRGSALAILQYERA